MGLCLTRDISFVTGGLMLIAQQLNHFIHLMMKLLRRERPILQEGSEFMVKEIQMLVKTLTMEEKVVAEDLEMKEDHKVLHRQLQMYTVDQAMDSQEGNNIPLLQNHSAVQAVTMHQEHRPQIGQ